MKILVLGDVMGLSKKAIKKLSEIISENNIQFSVINGENAAEDGKGITKKIAEDFFGRYRCYYFWQSCWDKEKQ